MNQFVPVANMQRLPAIVTAAGAAAQLRFLEFFAASIRNPHTRRAYAGAVAEFLAWCEGRGWRRSRPSSRCTSPPTSRR